MVLFLSASRLFSLVHKNHTWHSNISSQTTKPPLHEEGDNKTRIMLINSIISMHRKSVNTVPEYLDANIRRIQGNNR